MTQPDQPQQDENAEFLAEAWERHRTHLFQGARPVSEWLVEQIDPRPGQTILELAAGPGETGFLAADRIGAEGRLISSDLSAGMVDAARRGAEARGLGNVEFCVMDAQAIELPDSSIDAVLSRFGVMLAPEPPLVVREARRVLRDGGRLAYAVWGPPDRNPWLTLFVGAVLQTGHVPSGDAVGPGGVFSLAALDANREILDSAGFSDVRVDEIPCRLPFDDFEHYWAVQSTVAGPIAILVSSLPADEVEAIKTALEPTLAPYRSGDALSIPSLAIGVSATERS